MHHWHVAGARCAGCAKLLKRANRCWERTVVAGHHPVRPSVARTALSLLQHARRNPTLSCRADADSNEPVSGPALRAGGLPISLRIRSALPVAHGNAAQGAQQVAEHAIRVVMDAAWQAEHAAQIAEAVARGARRRTLLVASFGALGVLFGIAVVAASRITTRINADMASVAAAMHRLDATQRQINDRLTTLQASSARQAALDEPTNRGPIIPVAPSAAAPVAPTGPALPGAIKPLPALTSSVPDRSTRRQSADRTSVQRARLDRTAPSPVAMATMAAGSGG